MMIKLIACDMDGTLLNGEGKLGEEFYEVFKELKARDIKFVVASGRQYDQLKSDFKGISDELVYIAENGTLVKYRGEELYSNPLDKAQVKEILQCAEGVDNIHLVLCGKKCAYISSVNTEMIKEVEKYYFNYEIVERLSEVKDEILKVAVLDLKGPEEHSYKVFHSALQNKLQVTISGKIWLDIYVKEANKGVALRLLQDRFSIGSKETMAFGDYFNDIEMLKAAYHSYAMENAPDDVKSHARFVAPSNKENGVIKVIKAVVMKE